MKKLVLLLPLLSFLQACVPPMTREQQLSIYRTRCLEYGYQFGTREFANCMQMQEAQEQEFYLQERKVRALENRNWIEENKIRVKEEETRKNNKK